MIRIDDSLLEELGLISLPKQDRDNLLRKIYETLEMRVGMKLAERMSEPQLDEFERFIEANDEAGALKWLEANFPDYKQVVANELEVLKGEIKKDADKILSAVNQQAPAQAQQQVAAPYQPTMQPQQPSPAMTQPAPQPPLTPPSIPQPSMPAQPQQPNTINTSASPHQQATHASDDNGQLPSLPNHSQPQQPTHTQQHDTFADNNQNSTSNQVDSSSGPSIPPPPA